MATDSNASHIYASFVPTHWDKLLVISRLIRWVELAPHTPVVKLIRKEKNMSIGRGGL